MAWTAKMRIRGGLRLRIILTIGLIALAASISIGLYGYSSAKDALTDATRQRLALISESRTQTLRGWLEALTQDLGALAESAAIRLTLTEVRNAYLASTDELGGIREHFASPAQAEDRLKLDGSGHQSLYGFRHAGVHASFRAVLNKGGYADILVLTEEGEVIYSAAKWSDFATNVKNAAGTGLAKAFEAALKAEQGQPVLIDFEPYAPGGDQPSAFIAQVLQSAARGSEPAKLEGVLVYRITTAAIDRMVSSREGLGQTGETYLVGRDRTLRSNRPLASGTTVLQPVGAVEAAIPSGAGGAFDYVDAQGKLHFAAANAIRWLGTDFTLVTDQTAAEALAQVTATGRGMLLAGLVILACALALAVFTGLSVVKPIKGLTNNLRSLATGAEDTEITGRGRSDEIGDIARAVEAIRDLTRSQAEARREAEEAKRAAQEKERAELMRSLAAEFEQQVGSVVQSLGSAAQQLKTSAQGMAGTAERARTRSESGASATEAASASVRNVAVAAEELDASIREFSNLVTRFGETAQVADRHAGETTRTVGELSVSADRIGEVVSLIEAIANQTNLLALNATIEAARAGEAGRGFAVVASEVKELASQTAKATVEIATQIEGMRTMTRQVVGAIGTIERTIREISSAVTSAMAGVTQQANATGEIAANAQNASDRAEEVAATIDDVRSAVLATDEASTSVVHAADDLVTQAADLDRSVQAFLRQVRAA